MESSERNGSGSSISEKICPTMLVFDKYSYQMFFFQNIPTYPIISKNNFYDTITLELYFIHLCLMVNLYQEMNGEGISLV